MAWKTCWKIKLPSSTADPWIVNYLQQLVAVSDESVEDGTHRFSYHVFATGTVWVAPDTLGSIGCSWDPWTVINVVWGQIQRTHDDGVLVLTEVKDVPRLEMMKRDINRATFKNWETMQRQQQKNKRYHSKQERANHSPSRKQWRCLTCAPCCRGE